MNKIDNRQSYQVGDYFYKNFVELDEAETKMVWMWRNDERIREWMTNKDVIPFANHLNFVNNLKTREDMFYWLVYKNDQPVAVLDIIDVDYVKEETEPGYYLNPDLLNSGEGLFFNYNFRNFLFNELGFEYVKGNIKVGNNRAYTLSTFYGVKATGLEMFADGEHLIVKGSKFDFNTVSEMGLLRNFVRYSKLLNINWEEMTENLRK